MVYIGSKISLISTSNVRYEGILWTIEPEESTIALKDVKCMGSEDRLAENKVAPSSRVYEFIIFKGENIKSMKLVQEEQPNVLDDPAVLEVKHDSSYTPGPPVDEPSQIQGGHQERNGVVRVTGRGRRGRGRGQTRDHQQWQNYIGGRGRSSRRRRENHNTTRNARSREAPGTGKFLEQRAKDDDVDINITDEFDFETNLARFDMQKLKEAITDEEPESNPTDESKKEETKSKENGNNGDAALTADNEDDALTEPVPAYRKDNFFDSLSTDRDDLRRPSRSEMSELNGETFGKVGSTYRCRTRGFRRRRGNFRNRGVFRGGYNQRNQ